MAHDAGPNGLHGDVRGASWTAQGKFGSALSFDGRDDCVFRKATESIRELPMVTVECWFRQRDPSGRQFLVGRGVSSRLRAGGDESVLAELPYTYTILGPTSSSPVVANENGHPVVTVNGAGSGRVTVCAADHWLTDELRYRHTEIVNMEPPCQLLHGLRTFLTDVFGAFAPVSVDPPGLTIRTCCYDREPKRLLVGLMNNDLFTDWDGALTVRVGGTASATDIWRGRALTVKPALSLSIPAGEVGIVDIRLR